MRMLLLSLILILASCGKSEGDKIMRYEIKTIDSAVLQQILIDGNSISYFIFLPQRNKSVESELKLKSDRIVKIRQLIKNVGSINCKYNEFADDQIIEIESDSKKIVCRESSLHSYPQILSLVSEFRILTREIIEILEK